MRMNMAPPDFSAQPHDYPLTQSYRHPQPEGEVLDNQRKMRYMFSVCFLDSGGGEIGGGKSKFCETNPIRYFRSMRLRSFLPQIMRISAYSQCVQMSGREHRTNRPSDLEIHAVAQSVPDQRGCQEPGHAGVEGTGREIEAVEGGAALLEAQHLLADACPEICG